MQIETKLLKKGPWPGIIEQSYCMDFVIKYGYEDMFRKGIEYLPHYSFLIEYLSLGDDLKFEATDYYNYHKNIIKIMSEVSWFQSEQDCSIKNKLFCIDLSSEDFAKIHCENFAQLINNLKHEKQNSPVSVHRITDDLYEISDGLHRAAFFHLFNKTVDCKIVWEKIKFEWDLDKKIIDSNEEFLASFYEPFAKDNLIYQPIWWKSDKEPKLIRDSYSRLKAIIEDIYNILPYKDTIKILDIGANMAYFSSALSFLENTHVTAMDIDANWVKVMELKQSQTYTPHEVKLGTVNNIDDNFDVSIYLHTFHNTIPYDKDDAMRQFEKICDFTTKRLYLCLGNYNVLSKYGDYFSAYQKSILNKYGFKNIRIIDYNKDYKAPLFVAEK